MKKKWFIYGLSIGLVLSIVLVVATPVVIDTIRSDFNIIVNGKQIDTQPIIIDQALYLPIVAMSDSLRLKVTYDDSNKVIEISNDYEKSINNTENTYLNKSNKAYEKPNTENTYFEKSNKVYDKPITKRFIFNSEILKNGTTEEKLKEIVSFKNDITLFTLYAFLNHTGYDDVNFKTMGTVRKMVRKELNKKEFELSNNDFFLDNINNTTHLFSYLYNNGTAPEFHPYEVGYIDMSNALREFYQKANIPKLYEKYSIYYNDEIAEYEKEVYIALTELVDKFNIPLEDFKRPISVYINLLDLQARAGCFIDNSDEYREIILNTGPTKPSVGGVNIGSILHEFSHIFVSPILNELQEEVSDVKSLLQAKYGSPITPWASYDNWRSIIEESFVRAFDVYPPSVKSYQGKRVVSKEEIVKIEVKSGFVMTEYIYDKISEVNNCNDLKALIKQILQDYILDNK